MFSMIGNLSPEDKPFKVRDTVYFKGNCLFIGKSTEKLKIKEIKYGRGGYMIFEGIKSGEIAKKKYDEVFDQWNLVLIPGKR